MRLLIVESPSKAKTIEKYLGKDFRVVASVGHIRDLPKSNKAAIDIEAGFVPRYEVVKGKEKVISEIKSLAKKADEVILATDPDREGEAIAWHVAEAVKLHNPKRIVFHEITKEAVEEALEHPRAIDEHLREAQEARRVLDRLVGYDLSGLIWKKVRYGLSAGRVQSPALRIIMEREREIRAFVPEKFWKIWANLNNLDFECSIEPRKIEDVEKILAEGKKGDWQVTDIKETKVARAPRAPFITSTLQQYASSRLGWSPSRAMSVAQKLYEAGYITYMRTDSTNLSQQAKAQIKDVVEKKYGAEYFESHAFAKKSKNAQEAHEAIRPTHVSVERAGSTDDQHKLYSLIWSRTVASQMKPAEVMRTKVVANIDGRSIPDFWLNGSRILFPGWLKADPASASEDVVLPKFAQDENLKLSGMRSEEKETTPPPRYSEAGLIKELEKRGIGRPSTYASIIKTLEDRGYVNKLNKALFPTDTGEVVSTFLENHFASYISDSFTAEMEDELDEIANGDRTYLKTLKDFYVPFTKEVKAKEKIEKITNLGAAPADMKCPVCGGEMIIKLGKSGKFYSCEKFPDCTGARTMEGKELEGPKDTGEKCPKCGEGNLVTREGKFGMFTACSRFPKCRYVKKDEEQEKQNSTGIECPVCKAGFMTERRGRYGVFYSCSNYPDCKYAIKAKPTGNICKICGALMMEGTKTIPERCSDKSCPNHNPHKLDKIK
ncbi:MAG: DNA topoisomerase I [Candidatus Zambryskibacteria bacterium RIFCSPLOWO2_02_FULL_51_21]|uniref:DNA topoisomerase 1 n=1 Tax=Candidatus Zambryskibacteria bacterium RIFCSPHIGHO2_02_FULL_43_37 TaxID=1802749 RepID=A0A1G2THD0_9BACT|nr:MAG: DNA topoisomerase I [Candidatus Zambryskibacteria bacterium RIFCSPHIGHO2_01_FULL_52_18]OHA96706.1 MAG: DNA topoisomerase I [Candidatus Zambryskibacteria bacterium RIFCSPHIGHO2_02_FULL_43_37]OHB06727.1 MAG: DNA topoisomerase I [Candidatus Zambryskibacteria bacterium RIFCSPLOWO2_01_FULL_52_12]OHB11062.1 MAG: DNA topoisomerase I [Candidatus Zambryskibacteria bacterium RIFCSPLOWO2_02_FULL_51_21]